jgi:hypothetical protein
MSNKTIREIAIAVSECQPLTDEELRLGLHAIANIEYFTRRALDDVIKAVEEDRPVAFIKIKAGFAKQTRDDMWRAWGKQPKEWLGASHTPGTPEHSEQLRLGKAIFKKATGTDL